MPTFLSALFPKRLRSRTGNAILISGMFWIGGISGSGWAVAPVFVDPPAAGDVVLEVPCGKTLVVPVATDDADGDPVGFTAVSSDKEIPVRVITGSPVLKLEVSYAGTVNYPAFSGEMKFLLFREFAPVTVSFIGGFAQAAFYDNLTFHRLIPGFVVQGGDKAGDGTGQIGGQLQAPRFDFRNEFHPWLIFSGRGQLAMANRGYDRGTQRTTTVSGVQVPTSEIFIGDFAATNGSQFFITFGPRRGVPAGTSNLDFKHTIFGQLVRGFDLLDRIEGIPTDSSDRPTAALKIVTARLERNRTDAVLLVGAKKLGTAQIEVTATDGGVGAAAASKKTLTLTSVGDPTNDPPVIQPLPTFVPSVGEPFEVKIPAMDLEGDALEYAYLLSRNNLASISRFFSNTRLNGLGTPGSLDLPIGVGELRDPRLQPNLVRNFDGSTYLTIATSSPSVANPFAPFDPYGAIDVAEIGVGDKAIVGKPASLELTASSSVGTLSAATFRSASNAASPNDFTATVNWGDGTDVQSSTGTSPPITIARSNAIPGTFEVRGNHIYTRAGTYHITVTLDGPLGSTETVRSVAEVIPFGATIRASGQILKFARALVAGRPVATFTDTLPGTRPRDYRAEVDWGDGERSRGFIRKYGNGRFGVVATHRYADPGTYAVSVAVSRGNPSDEAVAQSEVTVDKFKGANLMPPYPASNITARWSELPFKTYGTNLVTVTGTLVVANGGSKASSPLKIRFFLSPDPTLDLDGANADVRLTLGGSGGVVAEVSLDALSPGQSGDVNLRQTTDFDRTLRLPKDRTGAGEYLIGQLVYSDPLTDLLPVPKTFVYGPLQGFVVTPSSLSVSEGTPPTQATFKVKLDTAPTSDVTVNLDVVSTNGTVDVTEATVSPTQLVFTPANGTGELTVTVTALDDALDDGTISNVVRLKAAVSSDPRFSGMDPQDVNIRIQDND